MMAEVSVTSKCNAPYLSYNTTESNENSSEHSMEIKTLLLKVLIEFSVMEESVELLQEEMRRLKVGVIDSTGSAVNTQYEANVDIQTLLKNTQLQLRKMDMSVGHKELNGDVGDLNQLIKTDEKQPVKEIILTEVNTIPAKVTSLYETIENKL
jgi:phosphatidate phosphatase PAH1